MTSSPPATRRPRDRVFVRGLTAIGLVALALRVTFVVRERWNVPLRGDAWFYYWQARLLSTGHGFINPAFLERAGVARQSADHPPLFTLYLTALDLLGLRSPRAQLITQCLLGAATVVVIGIVGRRLAGARVGLVAAAIAATYPPLWVNDGMLLSESLFLLLVAVVLLATYTYYESGSSRSGAIAGALIGLTALVRAEALLMLPLILVPAAVRHTRGQSRRRRIGVPLALAGSVALVISPWVAFNLARFDRPMFLNADGITLSSGNCRTTYHGRFLGYYDLRCVPAKPVARDDLVHYLRTTDESIENAEQRTAAFRYVARAPAPGSRRRDRPGRSTVAAQPRRADPRARHPGRGT